jgi:hypothetical protein
MVPLESSALWSSTPPASWPGPPAEMTVTTLGEIDACPRRWALSAAEYGGLWGGRGYPPRVQVSALAGTVVHLVLETITRQLVRARCYSVEDPKATLVLKELGGYTKVVHECMDRVLARFAENPRALTLLENAGRTLRGQVAELRVRIQSFLARMRLPRSIPNASEGIGPKRRGPLRAGAFPELELRAPRIGWKGKADLLVISDEVCEITDFKTGAPDEVHKFQVQVYALLWSLDEELNPNRRLVHRLVLAYDGGDVEVPAPTASQLAELEHQLITRREAAKAALSARPPEARPSAENCRYCSVRQLCEKYWVPETQRAMVVGADLGFSDVELKIIGRHGPSSWDAVIVLSRTIAAGKPALLRATRSMELRTGDHLRVLDAAVAVDLEDHDKPAIITLSMFSEIYTAAQMG